MKEEDGDYRDAMLDAQVESEDDDPELEEYYSGEGTWKNPLDSELMGIYGK